MLHQDEKLGLLAPVLLLAFAAVNFIVPSSFWMVVDRMDVHDSVEGQQITMDYERVIKRSFAADWRVKIRRASGDGLEWVCSTPVAREDYDSRSRPPRPVTLEWFTWTDARCYTLPPGQYHITATWEINPAGIAAMLFRRTITMSDTFVVEPAR